MWMILSDMRRKRQTVPCFIFAGLAAGCSIVGDSRRMDPRDLCEAAITASRDFVAKDESARRMFNVEDSLTMTVSDTLSCVNLVSITDVHGLVEALYPGRTDLDYLRDSLDGVGSASPPCKSSTQLHLGRLSTSSDRRATLIYVRIDSTFRTGYYAIMMYLYKNRRTDDSEPISTIGYDKMIAYLLVYNPNAELIFIRREERP